MTDRYDLHFYFDPVCPFAWLTSKWVRMVAAQRDYRVDWRFISLRILNSAHRLCSRTSRRTTRKATPRACGCCALRRGCVPNTGREAVGPLYAAFGTRIFDTSRDVDPLSASEQGARRTWRRCCASSDFPSDLADALDDETLDDEIRTETEEALALTGRDVGTPILHFQPPGGTAFFGPGDQSAAVSRRGRSTSGTMSSP